MFVGTFEHSLDDKGRLVLPATFRSRLASGGYLTPYENCLALWAPEDFEAFVNRLQERVREKQATPNALRTFLANTTDVKPDTQGRIAVPARLRASAGLDGGVVLNGALDHIELWNSSRWNDVSVEGEAELADAVANLGIF